jgi:amidophosphoribosyltransferase
MSRRPDGLLNHNVLEDDKGPQDACGVFGVWAPGEEVAKLTFYGLYASPTSRSRVSRNCYL